MSVTRIVPNLSVTDVARANALYAQIFGLDVGWISAGSGISLRLKRPLCSSK